MSSSLDRWRGKVALVTGASSGIGRAIAEDFGRLGLKVAVSGRRSAELETVADEIRRTGSEALILTGDQAEISENHRFFTEIRARWGTVDVLVNNAGVRGGTSLLSADWSDIQCAWDVNVRAALLCMREAAADIRGKPDAAVINISSMTGHRILPGTPGVYAATKHALRILTDAFRAELVAEKITAKVALLSPGMVDTPWHNQPQGVLNKNGSYPYEPLKPADLVEAVRYILAAPAHVQIGDIQLRSTSQPF